MSDILRDSEQSIVYKNNFPFYIFDTYGIYEKSRALHWHTALEICHIKEGRGKYLINGIEFPFAKDDVFIINNDEIHVAFDVENLVMQVVSFEPAFLWSGGSSMMDHEYLEPFTQIGAGFANKIDHSHPHMRDIIDTLSEIEQEYQGKDSGYELMIKSLLLKLMAQFIRYFKITGTKKDGTNFQAKKIQNLKAAISHIERHYENQLSLDILAGVAQMSISHFCHMFKVFTGISPIEYIIHRRIIAAKEELKKSDKKILEIAQECGFNSLSNFNHCFKSLTNMTPRQYREENMT